MPNRILKESICTSEQIDALSWFDEVVWYRLIVNCDDYGRMDGRAAVLRSRLFPLKSNVTDKSVMAAINHLATAGLVKPYISDGKPHLQIVTWERHQQVRAKKSKYPAPTSDDCTCNQLISDDSICHRNPIQSESESEIESEKRTRAHDDPLSETMDAFRKMRRAIKAELTVDAERLIRLKLEKLAPGDIEKQIAILQQSIERSWRGVFELKSDGTKPDKLDNLKRLYNEVDG